MNSFNLDALQLLQLQLNNPLLKEIIAMNQNGAVQQQSNALRNSSQLGVPLFENQLGMLRLQPSLPAFDSSTTQLLALLANQLPASAPSFPSANVSNQILNGLLASGLNNDTFALRGKPPASSGRIEAFPEKLHRLLRETEATGKSDIVSFTADDTFRIHDQLAFFREIMPLYFRQTKLTSFKRQLKLYGFELISSGVNKGGYRHDLFSQSDASKCRSMKRVAIKSQCRALKVKSDKVHELMGKEDKAASTVSASTDSGDD